MNESTDLACTPAPTVTGSPATGILPPSTGKAGWFLPPLRPAAPLEAGVVSTHGLPGAGPDRARSHHSWVPGAPRGPPRSAELCWADSGAGGRRGTLPGHASPTRQGQGRPSSRGPPGGPGPTGRARPRRSEGAAAARPARTAVEVRSLRGSSATEAGDADEPLPRGDSVPHSPMRPTTPAPARTGAGAAAAKSARRPH